MQELINGLFSSFIEVSGEQWLKMIVMWAIGGLLIYLAIKKDMEPALLLPMGFGAILVNLPLSGVVNQIVQMGGTNETVVGAIEHLFNIGIEVGELMPLLLFIGIGAMMDFGPLLSNPKLFLFGGAAQFGIFATLAVASLFFPELKDAAAISIIGAADGPTSIYVAQYVNSNFTGPIMVAAYSYMALVPIIQPPVIRLCTTRKERLIRMPYEKKSVSKTVRILFPIIVTVVAGLIAPTSAALVGFLMFGNLIRECGVLGSLSDTAQKDFANIITLLLGITIAFKMRVVPTAQELINLENGIPLPPSFLSFETLIIMGLGLVAFIFDTAAGVFFAKFLNLFMKKKVNPMIGAAGISAFPMSSRVIHKMGLKEDPQNFLLMHAAGANASGQIASVIAGGLIIKLISPFLG